MDIVCIFVGPKAQLYAIRYPENTSDEYHRLLEAWQDSLLLYSFFKQHADALRFFKETPESAARRTIQLAYEMEAEIDMALAGDSAKELADLFKPLSKPDDDETLHITRRKQSRRWLRMYALRIGAEVFVITGGAIKLSKKMQDAPHTKLELEKMKSVKTYLLKHGLLDKSDFEELEF